jgi:hypothetical protein
MESWQVIIISLAVGAFGSVGAWVLLNLISHDKSISKMQSGMTSLETSVKTLSTSLDNFSDRLDGLGDRLDGFINKELDTLKNFLGR